MLKDMFKKKETPVQETRAIAVINPNNVAPVTTEVPEVKQEATQEIQEQDNEITNIIVSSEALNDGTFRYGLISNKIYPIGKVEITEIV